MVGLLFLNDVASDIVSAGEVKKDRLLVKPTMMMWAAEISALMHLVLVSGSVHPVHNLDKSDPLDHVHG